LAASRVPWECGLRGSGQESHQSQPDRSSRPTADDGGDLTSCAEVAAQPCALQAHPNILTPNDRFTLAPALPLCSPWNTPRTTSNARPYTIWQHHTGFLVFPRQVRLASPSGYPPLYDGPMQSTMRSLRCKPMACYFARGRPLKKLFQPVRAPNCLRARVNCELRPGRHQDSLVLMNDDSVDQDACGATHGAKTEMG
jgi:hypothetical protein